MENVLTLDERAASQPAPLKPARDWLEVLQRYRQPDPKRSALEILITVLPFAALWLAAYLALSVSYWLTLAIAVPAAGFLVRLFLIQHDCGHGAFFKKKNTNDWVGRVLGIFTLTPYDVWKRAHAIHHASSGNLDERGIGDIDTLTITEYRALPRWRQLCYRVYRNPFFMFVIGPAYLFLIQHRIPPGAHSQGLVGWASVGATNIGIAAVAAGAIYLIGIEAFLMVHLPIVLIASSVGVWLFYVQHQFEDTVWQPDGDWNQHDAALYGSSHYDLPGFLPWLTAHIGIHHVHHLYSRIPFYRLPQVLRDFPELGEIRRVTLLESFACVKLRLWDENRRRLVSFAEAGVA